MAQYSPEICVLGSSNIDLTFRTSRLPRPGETLTGQSFHLGFGGKGGNQAVMAARLGAPVRLITKIGRDVFGEKILQNYQDQGIDTSFILFDETEPTGTAAIMVDDDAHNCIIVVPGANGRLTPAEVRAASAAIEGAAFLLCQLEVPVESVQEGFRLAKGLGVKTILNPAPAGHLPLLKLLSLTDYCILNRVEMEFFTDPRNFKSSEELDAKTLRLLGEGAPHTVIVTQGEKGCLIVERQKKVHVPGISVQAVDTTGAGDAFIGSLAVFLSEGIPLEEAARKANAVAALSVTRMGTQASFPSRAEVEAFLTTRN